MISRVSGTATEIEMNKNGCYVYILWSDILNKYYIGSSKRLLSRIRRHNKGLERYTRAGIPWILIVYRWFECEREARIEEYRIKKLKGNSGFKKIVKGEVAEWPKAATC
ncbi:MAG TPA: GIY-YIG nuclease family protein [Candidatus Dojkabacteria bacterium]|nr:GIY-YIG nuclease family protein [Candidatus Dojkabacteria bacterium]